jgi:hypothetical protein
MYMSSAEQAKFLTALKKLANRQFGRLLSNDGRRPGLPAAPPSRGYGCQRASREARKGFDAAIPFRTVR